MKPQGACPGVDGVNCAKGDVHQVLSCLWDGNWHDDIEHNGCICLPAAVEPARAPPPAAGGGEVSPRPQKFNANEKHLFRSGLRARTGRRHRCVSSIRYDDRAQRQDGERT